MAIDTKLNQKLKEEIASQYEKLAHRGNRKSFYIIARALVKLGIDLSKAKAGGGWTCGYHGKSIRDRIQTQLEKEYTEETLNGLILYCISGESDAHYEAILCDLAKKVPSVYVNGI